MTQLLSKTYSISDKLKGKKGSSNHIIEQKGSDITIGYFQQNGFSVPILVREVEGLSLKTPDSTLTVSDFKRFLGSKRTVKINVNNSLVIKEWTISEWLRYFDDSGHRQELLYLKDFEYSTTKLQMYVDQPLIVKRLDWVQNVWPKHKKEEADAEEGTAERPRCSQMCSMVMTGIFQDFELDAGGASRWYHIFSGRQTMWLVNGSMENWEAYKDWIEKGKNNFFGDVVKHCLKIQIISRNTIFIPAGWIYALYTSQDSIVFSGLFLHSFSIPIQLSVHDLQLNLLSDTLKYPNFYTVLVHVMERYNSCIGIPKQQVSEIEPQSSSQPKMHIHLSKWELEGVQCLATYLENNRDKILIEISELLRNNFDDMLKEFKDIVKLHSDDDRNLATTGKPTIYWPYKKRTNEDTDNQSSNRRRRVRCKRCEACSRNECGECSHCKDMKKFGGLGKMKQTCINRQCLAPMLPTAAICCVCGQSELKLTEANKKSDLETFLEKLDESQLMECSICFEVAHPFCLRIQSDCEMQTKPVFFLNHDMPNSWICPKCSQLPNPQPKKTNNKLIKKQDLSSDESDFENENNSSNCKKDLLDTSICDELPELTALDYKYCPIPYCDKAQFVPKVVVRPCPFLPLLHCQLEDSTKQLSMQIWLKIFCYLSASELCTCALVCKAWNQWSFNHKLWNKINLSYTLIKKVHLVAIVRRQPSHLNLSHTNISGMQLAWLLPRLPHLISLNLTLSSWPSISPAICSPQWRPTRFLTSLSLGSINHLDDAALLCILSAPSCGQESGHTLTWRLRQLCISGTSVTTACVRCISEYLTCLTSLDVGFNSLLDEELFGELVKWDVVRLLETLNVTQCRRITLQHVDVFRTSNTRIIVITDSNEFYSILS